MKYSILDIQTSRYTFWCFETREIATISTFSLVVIGHVLRSLRVRINSEEPLQFSSRFPYMGSWGIQHTVPELWTQFLFKHGSLPEKIWRQTTENSEMPVITTAEKVLTHYGLYFPGEQYCLDKNRWFGVRMLCRSFFNGEWGKKAEFRNTTLEVREHCSISPSCNPILVFINHWCFVINLRSRTFHMFQDVNQQNTLMMTDRAITWNF